MNAARTARRAAPAWALAGALLLGAAAPAGAGWQQCYDERVLDLVSCPEVIDNRCVSRCKVAVNIESYFEPAFDTLDRFHGREDAYSRSWRSRLVHRFTFAGIVDALDFLSEEEIARQVDRAGLRPRARKHYEDLKRAGLGGRERELFERFLLEPAPASP